MHHCLYGFERNEGDPVILPGLSTQEAQNTIHIDIRHRVEPQTENVARYIGQRSFAFPQLIHGISRYRSNPVIIVRMRAQEAANVPNVVLWQAVEQRLSSEWRRLFGTPLCLLLLPGILLRLRDASAGHFERRGTGFRVGLFASCHFVDGFRGFDQVSSGGILAGRKLFPKIRFISTRPIQPMYSQEPSRTCML